VQTLICGYISDENDHIIEEDDEDEEIDKIANFGT
jgi:hypothetical protein